MTAEIFPNRLLEWHTAGRPLDGHVLSGDLDVVVSGEKGVLIAVMDGLGHGKEAAAAAAAGAEVIRSYAFEPLEDLVERCNEALRSTRGVAMSLALFSSEVPTMTWLGVGNVEGVLFRAARRRPPLRESLLLRGGVVGYRIPPLRASVLQIEPGDTLILATDGIRTKFLDDCPLGRSTAAAASGLLERFAKSTDDALVLVARYLGSSP